jgi:class 3 adenylate cyclase
MGFSLPGSLFNCGLKETYDDDTTAKIQLTNKLSIALSGVIAGAALGLYAVTDDIRVFLYLVPFAFGPLGVIGLNAFHLHRTAKLYSSALYNFIIVFFSCLFGEGSFAQVNLIVFVAYPFLIFTPQERWSKFTAISFTFLSYILLEASGYSLFFSLELSEEIQSIIRSSIIGIIILENLILVALFVRSMEKAKERVRILLDRTTKQRDQINDQHQELQKLNEALLVKNHEIESANAELAQEKEKSDVLLRNILPSAIANRLKAGEVVIADNHPHVSVLFADIAGFTPMSVDMNPSAVVELLNEFFSQLDQLVDRYGLEKVKTIGDCYMVAAGIPEPREDHATVLARLALDIQDYVGNQMVNGKELKLRIGINSGPIVAGVIGRRKFIYDLWGDTVNTASRMESHGIPGSIQITRTTYDLLKNEFDCEPRGMIEVKGKGHMEAFMLCGISHATMSSQHAPNGT